MSARRSWRRKIVRAAGASGVGTRAGDAWEAGRFSAPYLRDDLLDAGVLVETLETAASWHHLPGRARRRCGTRSRSAAAPGERALVGCHVSHLYPAGASLYFTVLAPAVAARPARAVGCGEAGGDRRDRSRPARRSRTTTPSVPTTRRGSPPRSASSGVEVLRAVKPRLDPAGILNPGKLLP